MRRITPHVVVAPRRGVHRHPARDRSGLRAEETCARVGRRVLDPAGAYGPGTKSGPAPARFYDDSVKPRRPLQDRRLHVQFAPIAAWYSRLIRHDRLALLLGVHPDGNRRSEEAPFRIQQPPCSVAEAEIFSFVQCQANLLQVTVAAVVPQQPALPVKNRKRFITRVVVPRVLPGTDDRIVRMTLPTRDAVA